MFKNWLLSSALIASSFVFAGAATVTPAAKPKFTRTIAPFTAQLVTFDTHLSYDEVISRLDVAVNKTGSANFLADFHASKTKEEQVSLISGIVQNRNFLWFEETDHRAWMDVYDPTVKHPGTMVYVLGNPNFASQILPLEYQTGVNIPPRFLILEKPDGSGTQIVYHQFSTIFAPFNHNPELAGHTHDLDVNFNALFTGILDH